MPCFRFWLVILALSLGVPASAGSGGPPPTPPTGPIPLKAGQTWLLTGVDDQGQDVLHSFTVATPPMWTGRAWVALTTLGEMRYLPPGILGATVERRGRQPARFCFAPRNGALYRGLLLSGSPEEQNQQLARYGEYERQQLAANPSLDAAQLLPTWARASGLGTCEFKPF